MIHYADKVRLYIIINTLDIGGAERHLLQVLPHLNSSQLDVVIITLFRKGALLGDFNSAGIPVIMPSSSNPFFALLHTFFRLTKIMFFNGRDIFHFWLPQAYLLGATTGILFRAKYMAMSRRSLNNYQHHYPWFVPKYEAFLHKFMTTIFANSSAISTDLQIEGVPTDKIIIIPNIVDPSISSSCSRITSRERLSLPNDSFILLCIANLIPYKGHLDLLQALTVFSSYQPRSPWFLLCAGRDHGIQSQLEYFADQNSILPHIKFLSTRNDIPDLLVSADVSVLASHQEGSSNAILESMSFGLPVIATSVGGNTELIKDSETGLLVPPNDPNALAQSLLTLYNDISLRSRIGRNARDYALQNHSLSRSVASYQQAYSNIVKSSK